MQVYQSFWISFRQMAKKLCDRCNDRCSLRKAPDYTIPSRSGGCHQRYPFLMDCFRIFFLESKKEIGTGYRVGPGHGIIVTQRTVHGAQGSRETVFGVSSGNFKLLLEQSIYFFIIAKYFSLNQPSGLIQSLSHY